MNIASVFQGIAVIAWLAFITVLGMTLVRSGRGQPARGFTSLMIALLVAENEQQSVLTATENGFGKRTPIAEYTRHGRGTQGMIAIQTSERNGAVIGAVQVKAGDEIMLISNGGTLVRTSVDEVRDMGRNTQGVMLIRLSDNEKLVEIERVECLEGDDAAGIEVQE